MQIIADSGSTKTEWRIIKSNGDIFQARSNGINPYYQDEDTIKENVRLGIQDYLNENVTSIHFYGAGCSSQENIKKIEQGFLGFFPSAEVIVTHDLEGAARSLCGRSSGIACILGTGSNSCLYDGEKIIENIASLGYVLGDEGSGNYLGRRLLSDFVRNELPEKIASRLVKRYELSKDSILSNVYQNEMPVRYLASFSKFIFQNIKDPYLYNLVYETISIFFERCIMKYQNFKDYPVHFTGSVAFYYGNIVRKVAADKGINVRHIVESPIAGLTLYHQK